MDPTRKSSARVLNALIAFEEAWRNGLNPKSDAYAHSVSEDERAEAAAALRELEERLRSEFDKSLQDSGSGSAQLATTVHMPKQSVDLAMHETAIDQADLVDGLTTVFGDYTIVELLGKGAMASVYKAIDTKLSRSVALKIPHKKVRESAKLTERFKREARSVAKLLHKNICSVYDAGEIGRVPFMAMQFVEGMTLADYNKDRKISEAQAGTIIRRIARGLAHAHKAGVVHRDLKPANIMLTEEGEVIVMDFGLATNLHSTDPRLTQAGMTLGSPAYMSPEQIEGRRDEIGPQSDVFSLGLVMFELLTGARPFSGNAVYLMTQISGSDVPAPSTVRDNLSPMIDEITLKMTRRDLSLRYESMNDVIRDLNQFLLEKKQKR